MAWEPLGWEALCFSEVDDFPSAVLAARFPDVPNLGDITKVDWSEVVRKYGRPDVLIGGSPCQSFSIAGGRASLDGASRLMFEYIRACREVRSPWIVWENVPGVLSARDNAFGQLVEELQKVGYVSLAWRVLDAQYFGVAQRRRRVFLVGHLGDGGCAAAVLAEQDCMRGNFEARKPSREAASAETRAGSSSPGGGAVAFAQNQRDEVRLFGGDGSIASCVSATQFGTHKNETLIAEPSEPTAFKWFQGAAARSVAAYDDGTTPTLTNSDAHQPAVMVEEPMIMASGQSNAEIGTGGVAPTVASRNYKDPPILFEKRRENEVYFVANDNGKAAVDVDLAGTLIVGGQSPYVAIPPDNKEQIE